MAQRRLASKARTTADPAFLVRDGGVLLDPERGAQRQAAPDELRSYHVVGHGLLAAARGTGRAQAAAAAVEVLRTGLAQSTRDPSLHNGLGAALVERARFEASASAVATLLEAQTEFQAASDLVGRQAGARAARLRYDMNRAMVLWMVGERTADASLARRASLILREAAEQLSAASAHWAFVQDNLGNALMALGQTAAAITAYQAALTARNADADRARILNNLGTAYVAQGRYADGHAQFQAALTLTPRDRMPLDWARTQHNLGSAMLRRALAHPQGSEAAQQFRDAVEALDAARQERRRERQPLEWAITTANLAGAYVGLGVSVSARHPQAEAPTSATCLREALALYRDALPDLSPSDRDPIVRNIAIAEEILRRLAGAPDPSAGGQWPTETYTIAHRTRKETIIDYLTRVWLPLIQAGQLDLRTLRARDPSAAKAIDNFTRTTDPATGERRRLPPHLHLPTQKEVNDRLAAAFPDPGARPVRLDWALRARKRRAIRK